MGAHCITGYAGKEHITAADQGMYNAGTLGTGKYVLPIGSMFEAVTITNNLIKIKDGCLVNQGRNINIAVNDYEECEIDNGIQALKRNDLIVIRYEKNADTGIETASTIVIKGVSGETAVDPEYTEGNIFNGDNVDDFPLYRVKLEGLNITAVEPLFNTIVSFKGLIDMVDSLNEGLTNLNTNLDEHKSSSDHDGRYYTEAEADIRFERTLIHKDLALKAGRDIYLYPARISGYQLISATTNNNACYVTRFNLGSSSDTIVLSASPTADSTLYLTYARHDY